ncbi:hypothetical protein [Allokutzneria sp. NRRL B-24872]|uniref:hypothetical protein n=1 Tax=Allokutzneria sp. NRRL B-24872 TaxID=1137961 RepID=UPI000A39A9CE|nr:hypothetical protein [Allokutzneria sp. NRRL B-24872]
MQPTNPPTNPPTNADLVSVALPAMRLHPTPGRPGTGQSHIGGPLLWPADEAWPSAAYSELQLYRKDFPSLPFPRGTDLLQVLLCPGGTLDGPGAQVIWRASRAVTDVIAEPPPRPLYDDDHFHAKPCVLEPCRIDEHPLSVTFAQGCKVGGWTTWYGGEPHHLLRCPQCAEVRRPLIGLDTYEFPHRSCAHQPKTVNPVGWKFGSLGALYVFACARDPRHPAITFED